MIDNEQEYLTFVLNGEEYGIDILCVQEIRVWGGVTELPNKPDYIKGVINLRGVIIPIIDLRQRFGQQPLKYNDQTVTIILKTQAQNNPMVVGVIVDAVSEVYKLTNANISKAPSFGNNIDGCFLKGLVKVDNKLIMLLDSSTLLNEDDLYSAQPSNSTKIKHDEHYQSLETNIEQNEEVINDVSQ